MKRLLFIACLVLPLQFIHAADPASAPAGAAEADGFSGKVLETTNTAGYTYVLVDTGAKKLWAATTQFAVNVGDEVQVGAGVPMSNYHSKSLKRDFDLVYFTGSIAVGNGNAAANSGAAPKLPPGHPNINGSTPNLPAGHPSLTAQKPEANLDLTGIQRAEGGKTVAEIYAASTKLAGKPVTVRGKVVKYNAAIMGKNWLHLRDGSGNDDKKNNDLTVTTSTDAKLGDTVLVTGNVTTNRDFGAGYKYSVIIEDAKVTVE